MCGIFGILNLHDEPVDRAFLDRATDLLRHRGPDETGTHVQGRVGLGHTRLSIIDVEGGRQPLHNEDGTVWITFNGEIFNYVELRRELEARGHRFATRSDTEVIVHLYEDDGEDCVARLNGQWAFAIWDQRRERLLLSRDRLGVRPLFYVQGRKRFLFASEAKALLAHPEVSREIDLEALDEVFTFWSPTGPRTFFRQVRELAPGHSLTVDGSEVTTHAHWRLTYHPDDTLRSEECCADSLRELLIDATRIRLRSDVPVGAYLSGGLDSTIVTAMVRRFTDTPLQTFSVSFDDPEFDESSFQKEASSYLGTEHHDVRCSRDDICRVFPDVIWYAEKPILRTAPAPLFILSDLVRRSGYKVVVTGEGSDEMLGGYDIFKEAKIRRFWAEQPGSTWRPLLLRRLYPYLSRVQAQSNAYLRAFFGVKPEDVSSPLFSHLPRWDLTSRIKALFSPAVRDALSGRDALSVLRQQLPQEFEQWDYFSRAQYLESRYLLPSYILSSQGDRMAMAHGVEGRFPFLDPRVVDFASRLPPRFKMKGLEEKSILKRAAGDLIPRSVARRPKQPYRAPESQSFFVEGRARAPYVDELLSTDRIRRDGLFDADAVALLVAKARKGAALGTKDSMALVGILSTQLTVEQFINQLGRVRDHAEPAARTA